MLKTLYFSILVFGFSAPFLGGKSFAELPSLSCKDLLQQTFSFNFPSKIDPTNSRIPGWIKSPQAFFKFLHSQYPGEYEVHLLYLKWLQDLPIEGRARSVLKSYWEQNDRNKDPRLELTNAKAKEIEARLKSVFESSAKKQSFFGLLLNSYQKREQVTKLLNTTTIGYWDQNLPGVVAFWSLRHLEKNKHWDLVVAHLQVALWGLLHHPDVEIKKGSSEGRWVLKLKDLEIEV